MIQYVCFQMACKPLKMRYGHQKECVGCKKIHSLSSLKNSYKTGSRLRSKH